MTTGAPYEVIATCSNPACGVQVLVGSTYPWLPPAGYKCNACVRADAEALARRGKFQLTQPAMPKPVRPLPAESDGAYSKRAQQLGLLE